MTSTTAASATLWVIASTAAGHGDERTGERVDRAR